MTSRICGHIVDKSDVAVAEATVLIVHSPEATADIAAVSDHDGHFVFDGLVPGEYRLRARAPTGEQKDVEATVPEDATTAVLVRLITPIRRGGPRLG